MKIEYLRGSNVISIQPIRSQVVFPALKQVEAYWDGLRNGRLMPARSEVDPRGISGALDHAFVLELLAPGVARIRLAGHHLSELMGMEVRGMPLTALFLPEARAEVQKALQMVTERPASLRLKLGSDKGITRPALEAEMFLAPLRDDQGRATRIIGALQARGKIGRAPRRFTVRACEVNAMTTDAAPAPVPSPAPQPSPGPRVADAPDRGARIPGFSELAEGFRASARTQAAASAPQHPGAHLRLVTSNDDL